MTTAPDRVTPAPDPLRLSLRIDSPPESVHRALTGPDAMTEWLTEYAEVSLPDGRYEFWGRYTPVGDRPRQRLTGVESEGGLSFATAVVEPEIGGRYDFGWDHGQVRILELKPDRSLAYSWRYPDSPDTVVRWELRGSRGHTYLTLIHSGFADSGLAEQFRQGWPGFLVEIKRLQELGPRWQPIAS